jgi:hypothetical protein
MAIDISDVLRRVVYAPNGTGPYQFTFEVLTQTDIAVYRGSTLLTLTTDYTVSLNVDGTGSVTLVTTAGTSNITIVGDRGIARSTDFVTGGDLLANSLNEELDAQTIFNQQTYELALRGLKAPVYDPTDINMTLPSKSSRANKTLSFDADGNPTPGVSAADVANAVTYATNAANSATAAAASASAAASSASSASSSASTATTQASNASTSASNASTSATNASNSASSASTSASNAATSATNAANSASAASTSATNASNSASAASTSASNASTSATNAANSASAAATSETNAATSAAAAAAALDNFDDRYLGAKSSNPTVDNDGNALLTGALYYRTTTPVGMKVYDGAQWLEASAAQQSLMVTYEYVATAGQTTFSGTDANGATLSYVANSISVSLNGVTLRPGDDYTATNGTSVVLNVAAALNDDLMVIAFAVFNVANAVAKTGDTMTGALNLQANLVFDGNARRITGDFSNATTANRLMFQNSVTNGTSYIHVLPNGTATQSGLIGINNSDPSNAAFAQIGATSTDIRVVSSIIGTTPYLPMTFFTGGGEAMRIVGGSGTDVRYVGIGTSSPVYQTQIYGTGQTTAALTDAGNKGGSLLLNTPTVSTGDGGALLIGAGGSGAKPFAAIKGLLTNGDGNTAGDLAFSTRATTGATALTERARIDSSGNLLVGATSGTARLHVSQSIADHNVRMLNTASSGAVYGPLVSFTGQAPNNTTSIFFVCADSSATRAEIRSNGGLANFSANNVNLSDERLKTDIQPAGSYLSKICAIPVKTFLYKDQSDSEPNLGVIAQDVEAVAPELVDASGFGETPEDGVPYKTIYQTDLQYALMKCIQEQQQMIETLQAKVAALEAK